LWLGGRPFCAGGGVKSTCAYKWGVFKHFLHGAPSQTPKWAPRRACAWPTPCIGARLVRAAVTARGLHLLRADAVVRGLHVHAARRAARRAQQRHVPQQARQRVVRGAVALPPRARSAARMQLCARRGAAGPCAAAPRAVTRGPLLQANFGPAHSRRRGRAGRPLSRAAQLNRHTRCPGRAAAQTRQPRRATWTARARAAGACLHAHVQRAAHGARLRLAQVKPEVLRLARLQVLDGHLRGAPRVCLVRVATELA